jgi:GntR family transcriptional regulator, transcriptional repressor for pyruvate dehydrogenase complex
MSERDDRLTRRSVATQAADGIRAMIIDGRLRPGDVLPSERQLAVELRISRPTVRQAISSLTAMNILEVRPGGGTFVTDLTPRSLSAPLRFLLQVDPRSH